MGDIQEWRRDEIRLGIKQRGWLRALCGFEESGREPRATTGGRMKQRLQFQLRQVFHDLSAGLLLRPGLMTLAGAVMAFALTELEATSKGLSGEVRWFFPGDVGSAQVVLGTIAGSTMTVVTVIYSILLVALSLASMQFSPRILGGFMKDAANQYIFGLFIGTFTYCLLVLRTIHGDPNAFVPSLSVTVAILLALCCLGALIFFIHNITHRIQANHIVDRIAEETLAVIDERFPEPYTADPEDARVPTAKEGQEVPSFNAGYIQLIDEERLFSLAREHQLLIQIRATIGDFVIEGSPLVLVSPGSSLTSELRESLEGAFDVGESRTLQQDIEYGVRQIVDIALKAISPAVNDPSTAATCIDQLSRILGHLAKRKISARVRYNEKSEPCLLLKRPTFQSCIDLSFNQIRQYGKTDLAVSLRMLLALTRLAYVTQDAEHRRRIWHHGQLICAALADAFQDEDLLEFEKRRESLQRLCGVVASAP